MLLTSLLVLAAALSTANGDSSAFPYSRCIDYSKNSSPYTLDWASGVPSPDSFAATFILKHKATRPKGAGSCYDIIEQQGVDKVQIDTSPACVGKVKVYINGKFVSSCRAEKAPHMEGAFIGVHAKPPVTHEGLNITVVGSGECADAKVLLNSDDIYSYRYAILNHLDGKGAPCCPKDGGNIPQPSPSPVPSPVPSPPSGGGMPPGSFPWCNCSVNNFDTPWTIQSYTHTETDATNDYTLTIGENGCLGTSPCCGMDLHKIEFNIGDACKFSISKVFMSVNDGRVVAPKQIKVGYNNYGAGALVAKFTDLGLDATNAYGTTILFSLKKDSECPTLDTWLSIQAYSIFSSDLNCCPTWSFDALSNVGGTIWGVPKDDGSSGGLA